MRQHVPNAPEMLHFRGTADANANKFVGSGKTETQNKVVLGIVSTRHAHIGLIEEFLTLVAIALHALTEVFGVAQRSHRRLNGNCIYAKLQTYREEPMRHFRGCHSIA